jgi:hypothetical protein
MNEISPKPAFDVAPPPESGKAGVQTSFRLSKAQRLANDPLNVAKMMADTSDRLGTSAGFVAGTIDGIVEEGMYAMMRGGFMTDTDIVTVKQDAAMKEVSGHITTADFQRAKLIIDHLAEQYSAAVDALRVHSSAEISDVRKKHRETLQAVFTGTNENEEKTPVLRSEKPLSKVGNFVGLDMTNLQHVPADTRELILLQRRGTREVGLTVLSVRAERYRTAENGQPIDVLNSIEVVTESHLETRIILPLSAEDEACGFLSNFTCGEEKHSLPVVRFFYRALLPKQSVLHMTDRGGSENGIRSEYIEDNFDEREPLEEALRRAEEAAA